MKENSHEALISSLKKASPFLTTDPSCCGKHGSLLFIKDTHTERLQRPVLNSRDRDKEVPILFFNSDFFSFWPSGSLEESKLPSQGLNLGPRH